MLVGVSANDPWTFGGSALFLVAVTLLASYCQQDAPCESIQ
jgi:hypothetical protein